MPILLVVALIAIGLVVAFPRTRDDDQRHRPPLHRHGGAEPTLEDPRTASNDPVADPVKDVPQAEHAVVVDVILPGSGDAEPIVETQPVHHTPVADVSVAELITPGPEAVLVELTPPASTPETQPALAPLIFIVDDSVVVRTKLSRTIEKAGYRILAAEHGIHAIELLQTCERPDLIITDIEMPQMDGYALIAALQADDRMRNIPLFAISGHDGVAEKLRTQSGVHGTHKKPWKNEALLADIATTVGPGISSNPAG